MHEVHPAPRHAALYRLIIRRRWADVWMTRQLGVDVRILSAITLGFIVLLGFVPKDAALVLSVAARRLLGRGASSMAKLCEKLGQLLRIIGGRKACPCRAHERLRTLGVEFWQNLTQGLR